MSEQSLDQKWSNLYRHSGGRIRLKNANFRTQCSDDHYIVINCPNDRVRGGVETIFEEIKQTVIDQNQSKGDYYEPSMMGGKSSYLSGNQAGLILYTDTNLSAAYNALMDKAPELNALIDGVIPQAAIDGEHATRTRRTGASAPDIRVDEAQSIGPLSLDENPIAL